MSGPRGGETLLKYGRPTEKRMAENDLAQSDSHVSFDHTFYTGSLGSIFSNVFGTSDEIYAKPNQSNRVEILTRLGLHDSICPRS